MGTKKITFVVKRRITLLDKSVKGDSDKKNKKNDKIWTTFINRVF